jgi:hypothetical protein
MDAAPVHRVAFQQKRGFGKLARVAEMACLTEVSVCAVYGSLDDSLPVFLESPHCPRLRVLMMPFSHLGPRIARALAKCPRMDRLATLVLPFNRLGDEGLAALASSPHLGALRRLELTSNAVGRAGTEALAASATLGGLEVLEFGDGIRREGARALARAPHLTRLRHLALGDRSLGALALYALVNSSNLAGLELLSVHGIAVEGALALADSPHLHRLTTLRLYDGRIGDEGCRALAHSPVLETVEELELGANNLTDQAAFALAASPYLERLTKDGALSIHSNSLTAAGMRALEQRFGAARLRFDIDIPF